MAFIFVEQDEEALVEHANQYGDALSGTPGKGQAILLTALNNSGQYALTVRNQDTTNGRTVDIQKPDGSGSWLIVDKNGNLAEGIIYAQQVAPSAPGSGKTVVYAKTDGTLAFKAGSSGSERPLNETNDSNIFLHMGA